MTSSPTASTTPADSWPSTTGVGYGYLPSMKCRSLWHSPAAAVRTSTSRATGLVDGDVLDHEVAGDLVKNGSAHSAIMSRHGPPHPAARPVADLDHDDHRAVTKTLHRARR